MFFASSLQSPSCLSSLDLFSPQSLLTRSLQVHLRSSHVPFSVQIWISHRILVRLVHPDSLQPTSSLFFSFLKSRSDPPHFSAGLPLSNYQRREAHGVHSTIHFTTAGIATRTQSDRILADPFVFIPVEQIQLESVPGASNTTLAVPSKTKSKDTPDYQMPWPRSG